ncbi:type I restriction endonuclease subunit R [Alcanivorax sp. S6407]|uniref:type I restriction endonuclease subunit R n=1 Tax=Alcanivorax sp. S6407 TaxID=2926424 RepID=UPI001FF43516|nr:type I restriction endonuclease subunit R [Alcanivorax sp. S6407]MCK0154615.1 type I restriction endonuclease subunit R [Alcanivorax sp. S6407]
MNTMTEDVLVQKTTADYLLNELGWNESVFAMEETLGTEGMLGRESETDIVLTRYLGEALIKLNPGLPDEAYQDAIRQILEVNLSQSMLGINHEKDKLYKEGVLVTFKNDKGERQSKRLRVFDYDNPDNNHFLIVRELWVKGDIYRRRADLVGFVNGIPLIFMEVKNLHKDVKAAYEQNFNDYKDTVPHLFYHNVMVILGNGVEAKIGSLSSKYEHFNEWKRLHEEEPGVVDMETLLKGVCSKPNLLDIFENYTIFDDSSGKLIKIVARNHQFLGVNRAVEAVRNKESLAGKLGVFWHTQGSGKSYSIVFFAKKVHRKLGGNYTFLVLTDRDDLDTQIYKTFAGVGLVDNDKDPCRAASGRHLEELLGQHKAFVFSLIQKFNDPNMTGSPRDDIIVITDEAHRTQYGTLSLNMRNALPNASYIGFTGTPLLKDDEITRKVFGEYVSTYDFQRAVEDKATVPLYYDARGEKLIFTTEDGTEYPVSDPKSLNDRIAEKLEEFEIDDVDVQQRLERELKRDYHIVTSSSRLEQIAQDFVQHYAEGWESGKAMLVCIDKLTCVRMYNLIQAQWLAHIEHLEKQIDAVAYDEQETVFRRRQLAWMKETLMAVIVSEEQGEVAKFQKWGLDITPHRRLFKEGFTLEDGKRLNVEAAFKREEHPFRVAIVCAMWLTGFDVPTLSTLYLDKPLKAHTLMQAIARANRVAEGKNNGLIVDYCGILKNLRKALADFGGAGDDARGGNGEQDPTRPSEELLAELAEAIALVKSHLDESSIGFADIIEAHGFARNKAINDAKEAINQNDQTRKQFEVMAREVFKKFKACINIRPEINDYRLDRDAINIIYKSLQNDRENADISHIIMELHQLVDQAVEVREPAPEESKIYDISKIDFDLLRREFEKVSNKRTTVVNLRDAIEDKLRTMLSENPLRTDYQKRFEEIVSEYNSEKDRQTIEQTFEELMRFVQSLDQEDERAMRENLTKETLALFDMLKKPGLIKSQIAQIKKVAVELLETLKAEQLAVDNWRAREGTRDAVKQRIYDFLYDENTGLPVDGYEEDDIQQLTEAVYQHVLRVYPKLPSPIYSA